jgi:antitoxin component YwqK of YwqJK toxin-antitoxin module
LVSFGNPYLIKRISDKDFRYEFYTTDKKINPITSKTYFWFKGGIIHEAQGGFAGDLLNDKFIKMYHSNQLAEQGQFKNGIRVGEWKTWYKNGVLATTLHYRNGLLSGKYFKYNEEGKLIESGKFSSNLKNGKWFNGENSEIITFKHGVIVKEKDTLSKSEQYRIEQENIKAEKAKEAQKELELNLDKLKLESYKAKTKVEKAEAREKAKKERKDKAAEKKNKKEKEEKDKKDSKIKMFLKNLFKKSNDD